MDKDLAEIGVELARSRGYDASIACQDRDGNEWALTVRNGGVYNFTSYDAFEQWSGTNPAPKAEPKQASAYQWEEYDPDGPSATPTLTISTTRYVGSLNETGRNLLEGAPFVRLDYDKASGAIRMRTAQQAVKGTPVSYAKKRRFATIGVRGFCEWAGFKRGGKYEYVLRRDGRAIIAEPKK